MTDVATTTTGSTVVEAVSGTSGPTTGQGVDTTLTAAVAEFAEKAAEQARAGGVRVCSARAACCRRSPST